MQKHLEALSDDDRRRANDGHEKYSIFMAALTEWPSGNGQPLGRWHAGVQAVWVDERAETRIALNVGRVVSH